ncbi:MAG: hypothetical protein IIA45_08570 [Bacteroidetes bacterium]|nr:hypothetical protein [Bacteroidota bacterium]
MKLLKSTIWFSTLLLLVFASCNKEPGVGGTSAITGQVWILDFDYNPVLGVWEKSKEYAAPDTRVFIVYGTDSLASDVTRTNLDGYYRFNWLYPGDYTVYAYSEDTTFSILSGLLTSELSVEITGRRQNVTADTLIIID